MNDTFLNITNLNSILSSDKGPVFVLNDINFSIPKGKIIGLVGESGSGKSQLCMAISGMQDMTPGVISGKVTYQINNDEFSLYPWDKIERSTELFKDNNNFKRKSHDKFVRFMSNHSKDIKQNLIGWIPQDPKTYLNPFWTIKRHFEESYKLLKDGINLTFNEFSKKYLTQVDLNYKKFKNKKPDELSGGEAQRLMIAFVLSKNPIFLIADESTTGLDVTRQKTIIDLFHKIRTENKDLTMIIISHDFGVLDHLVDGYLVMYGGFLCEYIKDKERINKFEKLHPYSKDLIGRLNENQNKIGEILIKRKYITKKQLKNALDEQKGAPVGEILVKMGYVKDSDISEALTQQAADDISGKNELSSTIDLNDKLNGCPYVDNCKILKSNSDLEKKCKNKIPKVFDLDKKGDITNDWIRCWFYE